MSSNYSDFWLMGGKARKKAVAIEREMGRERERRDERSCGDEEK